MKKFLLAVVTLLVVNGAMAQINVGVKAGVQLSNITVLDDLFEAFTDEEGISSSMKFGFHVGGFAEFVMNDNISIQPELLFSTQGMSLKADGESGSFAFNYLNLPVLLKVKLAEGFCVEVGPQVGYLLSASLKGPNGSDDIKDAFNSFDVAAVAGVSYTLPQNIVIGARYGLGLASILKDIPVIKPKNNVISLSVGYKF